MNMHPVRCASKLALGSLIALFAMAACQSQSPTRPSTGPASQTKAESNFDAAQLNVPAGYVGPKSYTRRLIRTPGPVENGQPTWLWVTSQGSQGKVVLKSVRSSTVTHSEAIQFGNEWAQVEFEQYKVSMVNSGAPPWVEWVPAKVNGGLRTGTGGKTEAYWSDGGHWKLKESIRADTKVPNCGDCPKGDATTWAKDDNGITMDIGTLSLGSGVPNAYRHLKEQVTSDPRYRLWVDATERPILVAAATGNATVAKAPFCGGNLSEISIAEDVSIIGAPGAWSERRSLAVSVDDLKLPFANDDCECNKQDCDYQGTKGSCNCSTDADSGACVCYCGPAKVHNNAPGKAP